MALAAAGGTLPAVADPRTIVILQSSYVPWKGYFDLIAVADEFILLDDAQYTRRDWRNRNRIKTAQGTQWLTIPVDLSKGSRVPIAEVEVADPSWAAQHWETVRRAYARAPHFERYADRVEEAYRTAPGPRLSAINRHFLELGCELLGITTPLTWSMDYGVDARRTERLVELVAAAGGDLYISGPAAKAYLDEEVFRARGIAVRWADYAGYPEYPQVHPPFDHYVSFLDLVFCAGPEARECMKGSGVIGA